MWGFILVPPLLYLTRAPGAFLPLSAFSITIATSSTRVIKSHTFEFDSNSEKEEKLIVQDDAQECYRFVHDFAFAERVSGGG